MEQVGNIKLYSFEEVLDKDLGKIGTPRRDAFEAKLQNELKEYMIGEAIRKARKDKQLTQEQLGAMMGVQRAQVSRIENGHNLTIGTIARAFKAMGIPAALTFGGVSYPL